MTRNDEADAAEDFVGRPTFVELDADDSSGDVSGDATPEDMTSLTIRILIALWDAGIPAIASCSSEDLLPEKGGIARFGS